MKRCDEKVIKATLLNGLNDPNNHLADEIAEARNNSKQEQYQSFSNVLDKIIRDKRKIDYQKNASMIKSPFNINNNQIAAVPVVQYRNNQDKIKGFRSLIAACSVANGSLNSPAPARFFTLFF